MIRSKMSNLACAHHRGSTPKGVMTSVNRGRTGVEGGHYYCEEW